MFSMKADRGKVTKNSHFLMISLSLNTVIIHCFQVDTNCKSPAKGWHWLTQNKNIKYLLLPRIPRTVKSRSTSMVWETLIRISCQTDWLWLVVLEVVNHSINGLRAVARLEHWGLSGSGYWGHNILGHYQGVDHMNISDENLQMFH